MHYHPEFRSIQNNRAMSRDDWDASLRSTEGIPLLVADADAYVASLGSEWDTNLDELPFHALSHLARYLPQLIETKAPLRRAIRALLKKHTHARVSLAVEAGCSIGSDLRALSAIAERVVGFDAYITPLRLAARHITGNSIHIPTHDEGRGFSYVREALTLRPNSRISVVCGDALDPPFLPESVDVVLATNVLDNVPSPMNLLAQMDAILRPGGLMIIASPFNWVDAITPINEQLAGGLDPTFQGMDSAAAIAKLMAGKSHYHTHLRHEILETQEVLWRVVEHKRCQVQYRVHVCALRKKT
jgi:SAM-dependent methyltransferase